MRIVLTLLFLVNLVGCGGGGGASSPPVAILAIAPIVSQNFHTSYENAKYYPINKLTFPSEVFGTMNDGPLAWGAGDFYHTGNITIFTATQKYNPNTMTYLGTQNNTGLLSEFAFWNINSDGTLTKITSDVGCLHPRKAVVADFNHDNIPDVFVACHGYDGSPWPGEKSKIVMSNGHGGFTVSDSTDVGFFHGASAADINNDGYPDIVVADFRQQPNIYFYINQGNGSFVKDTTRISSITLNNPYFSVELLDVNRDGNLDLLVGGHEQSGNSPTKILYGDNAGHFGASSYTIPSVTHRGVVLDFTLIGRDLYIDRTSDETSTEGFYQTSTLQKVNLDTSISTLVTDTVGRWMPWYVTVAQTLSAYRN